MACSGCGMRDESVGCIGGCVIKTPLYISDLQNALENLGDDELTLAVHPC